MFTINELIHAFDNNLYYAWEVLYSEILVDHCQINSDHLKTLITLYSKGVQKLTNFKQNHASYFKHKINSLMGQKKVIQCLNHESQDAKQKKNNKISKIKTKQCKAKIQVINIQNSLMNRKKQIQMRVAYDMQDNKLSKISKILKQQLKKQEKLKEIVTKCINSQQQKLKNKLLLRKKRTSFPINRSDKQQLTLQTSIISIGQAKDGLDNDDSVLQDISFLNSVVSDHES